MHLSCIFISQVNGGQEKCLVKFDDNTDHWSAFKHLAKLNKIENVMCVICKKSQTKQDNEVVVCDRCSRGYHQLCHQVSGLVSCSQTKGCDLRLIVVGLQKNGEQTIEPVSSARNIFLTQAFGPFRILYLKLWPDEVSH